MIRRLMVYLAKNVSSENRSVIRTKTFDRSFRKIDQDQLVLQSASAFQAVVLCPIFLEKPADMAQMVSCSL
jgi:hypothetical protein